uniref:C-C motif chemokine n=1 Tax=Electrophorus electricus TaxID=8005 RepID=A0AAY5EDL9_ELEEL
MSAIRLLLLSAVVLLSTVTLTEGMRYGTGPRTCCFDFIDKSIKLNNVRSYKLTRQQCNKEAVLFKMISGKEICVDPASDWVNDHMKAVDQRTVSTTGNPTSTPAT